jgi:hypothetical protein
MVNPDMMYPIGAGGEGDVYEEANENTSADDNTLCHG